MTLFIFLEYCHYEWTDINYSFIDITSTWAKNRSFPSPVKVMGSSYSEPLPKLDELGLVGVIFRSPDKIRILHSNMEFTKTIFKILGELGDPMESEQKLGVLQCQLPGMPFAGGHTLSKVDAVICTYFLIKMFEELPDYEPLVSGWFGRGGLDQGTLILKQKVGSVSSKVCCVLPFGSDRLLLIKCSETFTAVKEALSQSWTVGIQSEKTLESVCGSGTVIELKLKGNPWSHNEIMHNALEIKDFLAHLIKTMSQQNWRLLTTFQLRTYTSGNAMFFIQNLLSPNQTKPSNLAIVSPVRRDRLWLQNLDLGSVQSIEATLMRFYQTKPLELVQLSPKSQEYKLAGYPFWATGEDGVDTRLTMCRILETLREQGWSITTATMAARHGMTGKSYSNDIKTSVIVGKCESARQKFACVAPVDLDRLWLLNFPPDVQHSLLETVAESYLPGIEFQTSLDAGSRVLIGLKGTPWSSSGSGFGLHGQSMLMCLIKCAIKTGWLPMFSADFTAREIRSDLPVAASGSLSSGSPNADVQSIYFCCVRGNSPSVRSLQSRTPRLAELKVSDLEDEDLVIPNHCWEEMYSSQKH